MKKRPATETVEFSWNSTAPRDRKKVPLTRTRNKSKQSATDSPTLTVPTSWQGTLEEKILFLADRYVNHGDARLYWEIALELKQGRSKAAKDARERLARDTEALAGLAFFREIEPLIKDNARLEWLRNIVADSLSKRWNLQIEKYRFSAKQSESGKRKRFANGQGVISRLALKIAISRFKTIAAVARHLGRDVKTVKKYAERYALKLPSRSVKRR